MATAIASRNGSQDSRSARVEAHRERIEREFNSRPDAKPMEPADVSNIDVVPYKSDNAWRDQDRWSLAEVVLNSKTAQTLVLKRAMFIYDNGTAKQRADLCELVAILHEAALSERN